MRLDVLDETAASELLAEHAADLVPHVRDRLIADSAGNPLALIELSAVLSAEQRAGREVLPTPHLGILPVSRKVRDTFLAQIGDLPELSRLVLLVVAADTTEDRDIVLRAALALGASVNDLVPAESGRLIQLRDGTVRFRHPLIRSVVYESASTPERIAVHRALADVLDREDQAYRRAWHLAAGTTGPDERIAAVMERAAKDARRRGGYAAQSAALERAAQLSPDTRDRGRRLARAAGAAGIAGQMPHALAMAERASELVDDPLLQARVASIRAHLMYALESPRGSAWMFLEGAPAARAENPDLAAEMLINASYAAYLGSDPKAAMLAARQLAEMAVPPHLRALAQAATGIAHIAGDELSSGVETIRESLPLLPEPGLSRTPTLSAGLSTAAIAADDDQAAYDWAAAVAQTCRITGQGNTLPIALLTLAIAEQFLGSQVRADAHGLEALHIADATGQVHVIAYISGVLARIAAIEGDEQACQHLVDKAVAVVGSPEMDWAGPGWASWALGLLDLGLGRHESALARLSELNSGSTRRTHVGIFSLPDLVEASAAAGQPELGVSALERFEEFSAAAGQPWASAVALRCRSILGNEPEKNFAEAVRMHAAGGRPFERARTGLLYGQWLRRDRRRKDARASLRSALGIFDRLGAVPWADRARVELRATGAIPPEQSGTSTVSLSGLTSQELQVVRLAATGLSNRDIAARLFLSPRTVGYHLYKAYPKLGVTTRAQLARIELRD